MDSRSVAVVITDLDNTLFDWFETWHASFSEMLEALVSISGIPREQLIREIKAVHELHGTSEYAFLIQEVPSLRVNHQGKLEDIYRDAIDRYRAARKRTLKLYPSVLNTLKYIKKRGALIVGYTESMAFYTNYRVRNLGLDGLLDFLYSPKDHDLPTGLTPDALRLYPAAHYEFIHTEHRYTPAGAVKPNPKVLLQIISELGVSKGACIYVGDNRYKDVSMANIAGVLSVHAEYGEAHRNPKYDLLKEVTHWTTRDVASEAAADVVPKISLKREFAELLQHFDFCASDSNTDHDLKIWQTTVEVQKHFNDLSLKIRGLAVTVLGAILTASAFALKDQIVVTLFAIEISAVAPILVVALLAWGAFFVMDKFWYHRFLQGAVAHARKIEANLQPQLPNIGLTTEIGKASAVKWWGHEVRSERRLNYFYGVGVVILLVLLVSVLLGVRVVGGKPDLPADAARNSAGAEAVSRQPKPAIQDKAESEAVPPSKPAGKPNPPAVEPEPKKESAGDAPAPPSNAAPELKGSTPQK